jgi:hypothetical protein
LHTGPVLFGFGTTLALDFASAAASDQLSVIGGVILAGDVQLDLEVGYAATDSDAFVVLLNDGLDPIDTAGGFFALGEDQLTEGETFTVEGTTWTISYIGGTGNDVTLTMVPEPSAAALCLLSGLGVFLRRRSARRQSRESEH